jgi:hypothetical protein
MYCDRLTCAVRWCSQHVDLSSVYNMPRDGYVSGSFAQTPSCLHRLRSDGSIAASRCVPHVVYVAAGQRAVFALVGGVAWTMQAFNFQLTPLFQVPVSDWHVLGLVVSVDEVFVAHGATVGVHSAIDGALLRVLSLPRHSYTTMMRSIRASNEGRLLLLLQNFSPDQVFVLSMTPAGENVAEWAWSDVLEMFWCQDKLHEFRHILRRIRERTGYFQWIR